MALGFFWATVCLCAFIAVLSLDIMGFFSRKNHFEVDGRTVVLTGGSQGMGRGLGKLLAQKGANIVIVARNQQKLDEALKYISSFAKNGQTQRFHSISADVTKAEENTRIVREVTEWNNNQPPDVVWANAGAALPYLFIDTPFETQRAQMDLNYWAAAYLAQATLKSWLKPSPTKRDAAAAKAAKPRHFIMTGSVACFAGLAGYTPYAPAKSAMRSLADTLRSEMNLYNGYRRSKPAEGPAADVNIHIVVPATIKSPGLDHENTVKHPVTAILEEGDPQQTEDEVALASIKGLEGGGYMITTSLIGHAMRASMLGGSPRNNIFVDTVFGWVTYIAWLFIGPDMEGKVFNYGKKNKVDLPQD